MNKNREHTFVCPSFKKRIWRKKVYYIWISCQITSGRNIFGKEFLYFPVWIAMDCIHFVFLLSDFSDIVVKYVMNETCVISTNLSGFAYTFCIVESRWLCEFSVSVQLSLFIYFFKGSYHVWRNTRK